MLTSVFVPASFLPGITGQMFRQFALVIAATAIISAISALTLSPAQCALYLRSARTRSPTGSIGRLIRVYQAIENAYMGMVGFMVRRPRIMVLVFLVIVATAATLFVRHPTAFLPIEDQGYSIVVAKLPNGASQARSGGCVSSRCDLQANTGPQGLGDERRASPSSIPANLPPS